MSCSCFSFALLPLKDSVSFSFSISLIYNPVQSLPSLCQLLFSSLCFLLPSYCYTDQPSCLYLQPLHLLTRPPLLSALPRQTQCRTSAHILPFLHFFVFREQGVGQSLGCLSSVLSVMLFIPPFAGRLSGAFTCHC